MGILWPAFLLLLIAVPLLVPAYFLVLRRRKRFAVHYSSLSLIRPAMGGGLQWRRHLPFALMVLAILLLIVALSRPFANVTVSANRTAVMLALDVSLSMCSTDVDPNRFAVAQAAVERFIDSQAEGTRVGIVAFAGVAQLVVPPTTDREELLEATANLTASRGTAVGSAIARSLDALSEVNPEVPPLRVRVESMPDDDLEKTLQPDVIVLLTDGANTRGVPPLDAARAARDRGIQVYTVGFGTVNPATLRCTAEQLGGDEFNNLIGRGGFGGFGNFGGGFGRANYLRLDERTLDSIAEITHAEYYLAESADELLEVFSTIPLRIEKKKQRLELSAFLTAISGLLALSALVLVLRWNPLP